MNRLPALLSLTLLLGACAKVAPLRMPAESRAGARSSAAVVVKDVPDPPPEAKPELRNPFAEPDKPREDDPFDLPPTAL